MNEQRQIDYARIEKAIHYIREHFREQPSLDEVAGFVGLSPHYFQRMFTAWAGVSPKKFMQYLSLNYAKSLLERSQCSTLDAAYATGLSGGGRLHDLFVTIEAMTPGEYKRGGEGLVVRYDFKKTPFGTVIVASTSRGVCHMHFVEDEDVAVEELRQRFPEAECSYHPDPHHDEALRIFQDDWQDLSQVKLHLMGTPFQLKVWEALLTIPMGSLTTYGDIAKHIGDPKASRAVGAAVGKNPVAFLIPCHRVIQRSGNLGGYMWGSAKKAAMIGWEGIAVEKG